MIHPYVYSGFDNPVSVLILYNLFFSSAKKNTNIKILFFPDYFMMFTTVKFMLRDTKLFYKRNLKIIWDFLFLDDVTTE